MNSGRVLVVDDEQPILRAMAVNLRARGYTVDVAATGEEALALAARHHPDVVVLDLGLPGIGGLDVIRGLRGWTSVPIVILSARDDRVEQGRRARRRGRRLRHQAVRHGGVARPPAGGAAARLVGTAEEPIVPTDDFTVDLGAKRVTSAAGEIRLTPTEWHLVETLVRNAGRLVTARQLLDEVWGPEYTDETGYIRVHLAHVRRKLEPNPSQPRYFLTEPGMGYRFEPGQTG